MKKIASYKYALLFIWLALFAFNLLYTIYIVRKHINDFQALVIFSLSLLNAIVVALIWIGSFTPEEIQNEI